MESWLPQVAVAVIGLVGTVFTAIWAKPVRRMRMWNARRKRRDMLSALEDSAKVYRLLERIRKETSASRVLLLAGHNGGGLPIPGSPFYASVVFSCIDDTKEQTRASIGSYKNLPVDSAYIGMLLDLERSKVIQLDVAKMVPCQLRSYYELEGVEQALLYFITIQENKFMYVSVATHEGKFSEQEKTLMGLLVNEVRGIME